MRRQHHSPARQLGLEPLEDRTTPAVTASFVFGVLTVVGDAEANNIHVFANATGQIEVTNNGDAVTIRGRTATTANTLLVAVRAGGGNDAVTLEDSLGPVAALLDGGAGDDLLNGGAGPNALY